MTASGASRFVTTTVLLRTAFITLPQLNLWRMDDQALVWRIILNVAVELFMD